jgi:dihydroxyacetone kinase
MAQTTAQLEGLKVRSIFVADDCALEVGKGITGGRGIAGTVFVHKIAGAAAKKGASLEEVYGAAKLAAESVKTIGVALSTCSVPGATTTSSSRLPADCIELGMGIHGEPGLPLLI